jgi:hypothetical protein
MHSDEPKVQNSHGQDEPATLVAGLTTSASKQLTSVESGFFGHYMQR